MGLDITVYKNLEAVKNPELDEDGYPINWETEWKPGESMVWSETHFPGRGEGVDPHTVYKYEESFGFRAGSYSGYNRWRLRLHQFRGDVAFQELINFADNEGVIGPVVSKKLANDFAVHEEAAVQYANSLGEEGDVWIQLYQIWKEAFEMAAENGAVEFH